MPAILDPNWQRGYLVPYGRDKRTGKGGFAVPGAIQDMLSALMLPGDVYQGNVLLNDPQTGRTSDEVIRRSADLAGMLTLGSGAIPADPNSLRMGIKAYHGSPHDFDRFDMSKIGTGEGAQAYGHGLYFAENPNVAMSYRNVHAPRGQDYVPMSYLQRFRHDKEAAIAGYLDDMGLSNPLAVERTKKNRPENWAMHQNIIDQIQNDKTRMYEVNIDADPNDFLDWDKPLSEQPEAVRRKIGWSAEAEQKYRDAAKQDSDALLEALLGDQNTYKSFAPPVPQGLPPLSATGADIVKGNSVFDRASDVVKSRALKEKGIPGIKYLDAGSRGAGDGSRNYVVFDDKLISIVKKYGVAALVSAGVLSQAQGEEMKAQGYY